MSWFDTIKNVAPMLATALGGPMAGMAATMAVKALGDDDAEEISGKDAVARLQKHVMSGNPEVMLNLKKAENDFTLKLEELGIEREALYLKDRDSARKREATVGGHTPAILAYLTVVGLFGIFGYLLMTEMQVSAEGATLTGLIIGHVSAKAEQIYGYYFGSSAGQDRTNEKGESHVKG